MIQIKNSSTNPYYNLALEEYVLKQKEFLEDVFILWQNEPTIVIGKNQNAYAELNLDYAERNHIHVARRMSGGGAVYHDLGNLNFTVIKNDGGIQRNDFSFFARPVIQCLEEFGVKAVFNGRNDILIGEKKFSGNAQYFYKNKVLHHGTILFSGDLTVLSKALNVKKSKIESKGIKSVKSRVANIVDFLPHGVTIEAFSERLSAILSGVQKERTVYELSASDIQAIKALQVSKYGAWEWNFGLSPYMDLKKEKRFSAGGVSADMCIENGRFTTIKLSGDFFEVKPVEELERYLCGCRFVYSELEAALANCPVSDYILSLSNEEFLELLFG